MSPHRIVIVRWYGCVIIGAVFRSWLGCCSGLNSGPGVRAMCAAGRPERMMRQAGYLVALGALMMFIKGVLLVVTGNDRSLVPLFGLFTSIGLTVAAVDLSRSVSRLRSLTVVAGVFGVVGIGASIVAVAYLVTGTIPETDDASAAVGGSYGLLTIGVVVCLLFLGIVIVVNRWLPGRLRWLPLAVLGAQFPIFALAGAIGDTIGSVDVTDGLGLALTGAVWTGLGYTLTSSSSR